MVDRGRYSPTEEGTPQGGVISPLLLNVALQGWRQQRASNTTTAAESSMGIRPLSPMRTISWRCATVASRPRRHRPTGCLAEGPGSFPQPGEDENRTRRCRFDFLSFTIRRYYLSGGAKVLTTPSRTALKKTRQRLAQELRSLRGAAPADVIRTLNPIIRGQANYYRPGASTKAFHAVDDYLWRRLDKWARRRHPNKPRRWVTARYFGAFHPTRRDRWVFGDRDSGAYLHRYAWTKIVRHAPVPGRYSPDDPALAQYWADRRRKRRPPQLAPSWERALRTQHRRCPLCAEPLLPVDHPPDSCTQWETWYRGIRRRWPMRPSPRPAVGGRSTASSTPTARDVTQRPIARPRPAHARCLTVHAGCLSRVPGRPARTVLRGRAT